MRLLKLQGAESFSLVEFLGDPPPYAILSHVWGSNEDEVTYHDPQVGTARSKKGYHKLTYCGKQAAEDNLQYFWIDTCCIDKSISSELSEAINSMYFWYSNAAICYAYLSDIHEDGGMATSIDSSKWFTRGWTLQEFIAPKRVIFYSAEWQFLGDKNDLKEQLQRITKVPIEALEGRPLERFSIAQRMSWASKRRTTRQEDIAYCLMGLFDVNMPLLYGERDKAFRRLQEHILQKSNDQSLFAWKDADLEGDTETSIFARSPAQFEQSSNVVSVGAWTRHDSATVTPNGLRIQLWLVPTDDKENKQRIYLASLACGFSSSYHHSPGIYVRRLTGFKDSWRGDPKTQFVRIRGDKLEEMNSEVKVKGQLSTVHVRQEPNLLTYDDPIPLEMIIFDIGWQWDSCETLSDQLVGFQVFPTASWNPQTRVFTSKPCSGTIGAIFTQHRDVSTLTLFGVSLTGEPWIKIIPEPSFAPHEWSTYKPVGNETASSQVMVSEPSVACEARVWTNGTPQNSERKVFVILVAGKIIAPMSPSKSGGKLQLTTTARTKWWKRYNHDDSSPLARDGA